MKTFSTIFIFLIAIAFSAYSQTNRMVLVEEFTNASCGPCAYQNPTFDAVVKANPDKCVAIKYHTSFPGSDPMNTHNRSEASARVSYYSVGAVPFAYVNSKTQGGVNYDGSPLNVTQAVIDNAQAEPSPFSLRINQALNYREDSIFVTVVGKALEDVSGTLVLQCGIIEKQINYDVAPGSNGETVFYDVMKKMLPNASGTALKSSYKAGEMFSFQYAWKLENVYYPFKLGVVGFIQDNATKKVLQAARNSTVSLADFAKDGSVSGIGNLLVSYCIPKAQPTFELLNMGSEAITKASFEYRFNNDEPKQFQWTGNLPFLKTAVVTLPETTFSLLEKNTLSIRTTSINGVTDQNHDNDSTTSTFKQAPTVAGLELNVYVKTDNKPSETSWEIKDSDGNLVASDGPYGSSLKVFTTAVPLEPGKCYEFVATDTGGDGICCTSGSGLVAISYKSGASSVYLLQGRSFGKSIASQFYTGSGVGTEKHDAASFTLYPNPVSDALTIHFENAANEKVTIDVYNTQGMKVLSRPIARYNSGSHDIVLETGHLKAGVYNVKLTAGTKIFSRKISVVR